MAKRGAIEAGRAFIRIYADNNELSRGLRKAQAKLKVFAKTAQAIGRRMIVVASAMAVPFAVGTKIFAAFDDQMRKVKAITGATAAEFEMLTKRAEDLGAATSFTASQVASAMVEMGRAGFKPKEIDAAIEGMLDLSRATDTDLPRATEIAGNALRAFNLDASQSVRVADVLTFAANNSAQTLDDLGESMKMVAPLAVEVGEPIESVAASLGVLANSGIKGTMAGTAIARALKNLSNEGKRKALEDIGIQAVDAAGNLRPLADILGDLGTATRGMGSARRLSIFETLFGRGQAAALKLASSAGDIAKLNKGLKNAAGTARKTAAEMDAGIGGGFRKLLSASESIFIQIGRAISEPLLKATRIVTEGAKRIGKWIAENQRLVQMIAAGIVAVGGFGALLIASGVAATGLAFALGAIASAISVVGTALAAILSPLGLVLVALAAMGTAFAMGTKTGQAMVKSLSRWFAGLASVIETAFAGIKDALAAGDLKLAAEILWAGLKATALKAFAGIAHGLRSMFSQVRHAWEQVVNQIAEGFTHLLLIFDADTKAAEIKRLADVWQGLQFDIVTAQFKLNAAQKAGDAKAIAALKERIALLSRGAARVKSIIGNIKSPGERVRQQFAGRRAREDERFRKRIEEIESSRLGDEAAAAGASKQLGDLRSVAAFKSLAAKIQGLDGGFIGRLFQQQQVQAAAVGGGKKAAAAGVGPVTAAAGGFSAAAIRGLAGGSTQQSIADATELTAKNTAATTDAVKANKMKFT